MGNTPAGYETWREQARVAAERDPDIQAHIRRAQPINFINVHLDVEPDYEPDYDAKQDAYEAYEDESADEPDPDYWPADPREYPDV